MSPPPPLPPLRPPFSRLRPTHEVTLRELVQTSWDDTYTEPSATPSSLTPFRRTRPRRPMLPPRSATDVSGAAIHAARMAEAAAKEAADASAAAAAAAEYARRLAVEERSLRERRSTGEVGRPPKWVWPRVGVVALGKVWSLDIFAVWHNAIRYELCDLFVVLESIGGNGAGVNMNELKALFAWFGTFEAFVVTRLKAEEEVLYPWVEQWGRIEGELSTASRITRKGGIIRGIRDAAACGAMVGLEGMGERGYYDGLKVGFAEMGGRGKEAAGFVAVVDKVAELVRTFASGLLDYFDELERSMPRIIESLYDVEDLYAGGIERRMIRAMWKCGRKDESMVILSRAVEDSPRARQWMARNFKRLERMAMPLWKRRYYAARGAVVVKFKERKRYWERSGASLDASHGSSLHRFNLRMSPVGRSAPTAQYHPTGNLLSQGRSFNNTTSNGAPYGGARGS